MDEEQSKAPGMRPVELLNFFVADVQTGLGPFLAAYLAASGWQPGRIGYALTFGGLVTVAMQTPAGGIVDAVRGKRLLIGASMSLLIAGGLLLMTRVSSLTVYMAQALIGAAGPFLMPAVAAITLGMVGASRFDRQFGRNQSFNAAGNVFAALLIALISLKLGYRWIFAVAIGLSIPAFLALFAIDPKQIDYDQSRGSNEGANAPAVEGLLKLARDRHLLLFLLSAFLFHLSNAAMLPQLGEMLARGNARSAAPFMSACIIVTQLIIALLATWLGARASISGRKPLLLAGFGVLPIRGVLYTLTHYTAALIAIQVLDGFANAVFGVVSILVIRDLTRGTGRFNLASGALATMAGMGAAFSTTLGGQLIAHLSYRASFLGLAGVACIALLVLWLGVPETLAASRRNQAPSIPVHS